MQEVTNNSSRCDRCLTDGTFNSRFTKRGKLKKLGLSSYLKPKMSPVPKDPSSACARRGSQTQPCSAAALTSPVRLRPPQIRRADVTMPDRDLEATGGGKSCPAEVAVASPAPLPPFDPSPTPVALLPFPFFGPSCALTHSLARRAHFTVTPSLPAGSLALARSLVALPFLTEFRALSPLHFSALPFSRRHRRATVTLSQFAVRKRKGLPSSLRLSLSQVSRRVTINGGGEKVT